MSSVRALKPHISAIAAVLLVMVGFTARPASARLKEDPVFARSAEDGILIGRIVALSPTVDPEEARRVAATAYQTGRDLAREWRVVWPPGIQNFLVNIGARKGGLCFQWAAGLLPRLDALHLRTLELHWAESYARTASEHNVIVVTAIGQPMQRGILLDNWRYLGHLAWGPVAGDTAYDWQENPGELARRRLAEGATRRAIGSAPKGAAATR